MLKYTLRILTKHFPLLHPRESILRRLPDVPTDFGTFKTRNGIKVKAFPSGKDYIVKNLFWFGEFEPWVISVLAGLVKPGDTVCDIGGNIGDTALQIHKYLEPAGKIYSFEPVPVLQKCLEENVRINNFSGIQLVPKALSSSSRKLKMAVESAQPGGAKISASSETQPNFENIEVEVTTFDQWMEENKIESAAVCKVDVEGHEFEVFVGMKNSFANGKIGSIIFEHYSVNGKEDQVLKLLKEFDFKIYRLFKSFLKIKALGPDAQGNFFLRATSDYVAVKKDSIYEERLRRFL